MTAHGVDGHFAAIAGYPGQAARVGADLGLDEDGELKLLRRHAARF
jgi:hypothetical protein